MKLLDFLFPKRCVSCGSFGAYLCKECILKLEYAVPVCPYCQRQAVGGRTHPGCKKRYGLDGLIAGFRYRGPVKLAIRKIKYKWQWDIAETIVELFSRNIWKFEMPKKYIIVPIPLHKRRYKWRGFNQAELMCKILERKFEVPYFNYLTRERETKTQVGLTKVQRRENIKGAFKFGGGKVGPVAILVDDVYTTGATMQEACINLKKVGFGEVWGMVIALG